MARTTPTPEDRARARVNARSAVFWHIGAFVIINAFFWLLDWIVGSPRMEWAYWITIFWGFGLAFHVLAYLVSERGSEEKLYDRVLEEERRRETQRG